MFFSGIADNEHFVLCRGNCIRDTSSTFYNHSQSNWNLTIKQAKAVSPLPNKFLNRVLFKRRIWLNKEAQSLEVTWGFKHFHRYCQNKAFKVCFPSKENLGTEETISVISHKHNTWRAHWFLETYNHLTVLQFILNS